MSVTHALRAKIPMSIDVKRYDFVFNNIGLIIEEHYYSMLHTKSENLT